MTIDERRFSPGASVTSGVAGKLFREKRTVTKSDFDEERREKIRSPQGRMERGGECSGTTLRGWGDRGISHKSRREEVEVAISSHPL